MSEIKEQIALSMIHVGEKASWNKAKEYLDKNFPGHSIRQSIFYNNRSVIKFKEGGAKAYLEKHCKKEEPPAVETKELNASDSLKQSRVANTMIACGDMCNWRTAKEYLDDKFPGNDITSSSYYYHRSVIMQLYGSGQNFMEGKKNNKPKEEDTVPNLKAEVIVEEKKEEVTVTDLMNAAACLRMFNGDFDKMNRSIEVLKQLRID